MNQTKILVNTLKRIVKSKGMTYADLARRLSLSEPTIKRSFSEQETMSLKRVERICDAIGINFAELVRISEIKLSGARNVLTDEQEEVLSLDLNLFKVFYLLLKNWTLEQIQKTFKVPKNAIEGILLELDKLKLIELHAGNKIKLLTARNVHWKKNGPLAKIFESEIKHKFLDKPFDKPNEFFGFLSGTVSMGTQAIIREKIIRFEKEVENLIEMDLYLEKEQTEGTAFVFAMGPISLSIFE